MDTYEVRQCVDKKHFYGFGRFLIKIADELFEDRDAIGLKDTYGLFDLLCKQDNDLEYRPYDAGEFIYKCLISLEYNLNNQPWRWLNHSGEYDLSELTTDFLINFKPDASYTVPYRSENVLADYKQRIEMLRKIKTRFELNNNLNGVKLIKKFFSVMLKMDEVNIHNNL